MKQVQKIVVVLSIVLHGFSMHAADYLLTGEGAPTGETVPIDQASLEQSRTLKQLIADMELAPGSTEIIPVALPHQLLKEKIVPLLGTFVGPSRVQEQRLMRYFRILNHSDNNELCAILSAMNFLNASSLMPHLIEMIRDRLLAIINQGARTIKQEYFMRDQWQFCRNLPSELLLPLGDTLRRQRPELFSTQAQPSGITLRGHRAPVRRIMFSPTEKKVATGSDDHTAKIWDSEQGNEIHTLHHQNKVNSVNFNPNGRLLATASNDATALVWRVATGTREFTLQHNGPVKSAVFSPDGQWIVTASDDKTAKIWNAQTGMLVRLLAGEQGHTEGLTSAAFDPTSSRVVTVSWDNTAKIWDVATGICMHTLPIFKWAAHFNRDGTKIITGERDNISIWDVDTGALMDRLSLIGENQAVFDATFSPDDSKIMFGTVREGAFLLSGTHIAEVTKQANFKEGYSFNQDTMFDIPFRSFAKDHPFFMVSKVYFSPDSTMFVLITPARNSKPFIGYIKTGEIKILQQEDVKITDAQFNRYSTEIAMAFDDGYAKIWPIQASFGYADGTISLDQAMMIFFLDKRSQDPGYTGLNLTGNTTFARTLREIFYTFNDVAQNKLQEKYKLILPSTTPMEVD